MTSAKKPGPRKLTVTVLLLVLVLTPIYLVSELILGLQDPNAPPSPNEGNAAGSSSPSSNSSLLSSSSMVSMSSAASNSQTVAQACQNATAYTGIDSTSPAIYNSSTTSFPIFSMKPGESSILCVAWINSLSVSDPVNTTGTVSIGNFATSTFQNGTSKTIFLPSTNLTATPAESNIVIGGGAGPMLVVAYTIAASQASRGFYFLNVQGLSPIGCDAEFRLAVGYTFSQANETGQYFSLPTGLGSCGDGGGVLGPPVPPPGGIYSQVYATSGIQITNLNCSSFQCDLKQQQ
jgi:hypothetical protein